MRWEEFKLLYQETAKNFFKHFPEAYEYFINQKKLTLVDDTDGMYVIWEMGIMPYVLHVIKESYKYQDLIKRIFDFFEEMANSEEETKELLMYGVLEKLGDEKEIFQKSLSFMGNRTRELSDMVENFLGR